MKPQDYRDLDCAQCAKGIDLGFDFTMAFQPIVNVEARTVFAHEALVRGIKDEPSAHAFAHVNNTNRYRFDQSCRVKAVKLGSQLKVPCYLSINFMPNAIYQPELCLRTTLEAATTYGFPAERIIFEITEGEKVDDVPHLRSIVQHYKARGFLTAIDDFGAGYAGLNLLAEVQPNIVKLDMALIRGIDSDPRRRAITKGIIQVCRDLAMLVIAEGIETQFELEVLRELGVEYFQGHYFARPAFESLSAVEGFP